MRCGFAVNQGFYRASRDTLILFENTIGNHFYVSGFNNLWRIIVCIENTTNEIESQALGLKIMRWACLLHGF